MAKEKPPGAGARVPVYFMRLCKGWFEMCRSAGRVRTLVFGTVSHMVFCPDLVGDFAKFFCLRVIFALDFGIFEGFCFEFFKGQHDEFLL